MKTNTLIDLLVTGSGTVQRHAAARRFGIALASGTAGAFVLLLLVFGINPALRDFLALPNFWLKISFTAVLASAGFIASQRIARPGMAVGGAKWLAVVPIVAMWLLAVVVLAVAEPTARAHLVMGDTWSRCPFNIALLSVPPFIAAVWAVRGLAPTDLRLAGTSIGLFAGALGACVYGLFCSEFAPPFLAIWYVIGILIPAVIGCAIAPRMLRW